MHTRLKHAHFIVFVIGHLKVLNCGFVIFFISVRFPDNAVEY